ncbi:MAG: hypothetical protein FP816_01260 [Desulfobacteraceae bacterium]|nr:hypothetical protein [Desulfobacteraceae bacterium]
MHKIDSPNADASNEFRDGDPILGQDATEVWSKFLNTIQRELVAIPVAAGIALDDEDDTQVLQGILALVAAMFGGVAGANGYLTLPGGIIIQWGIISPASHMISYDFGWVNYPVPFPNNAFCVIPALLTSETAALMDNFIGVRGASSAAFRLQAGTNLQDTSSTRVFGAYWLAIGN